MPTLAAEADKTQNQIGRESEISKLNAEIKEAEAKIRETMKEVQKAIEESIGGSSDQAQMLQSKLLMQQQVITIKQMQVKEIESPPKNIAGPTPTDTSICSRFDQLVLKEEEAKEPDNVYRLEENDGTLKIIFNRPEDQASTSENRLDTKLSDLSEAEPK